MQSILAILVLFCSSQVFCGTIVTFDQIQQNPAQTQQGVPIQTQQQQGVPIQTQQGVPIQTQQGVPVLSYHGLSGIGGVKIDSQNKNANLNDIRIGSGAGAGGDLKIPNFGWDTDEVKIDWSGKQDSGECAAGSSTTANPLADPTATTSTTTSSTTTISPNCTCEIKSNIDPNFGIKNCTFYAEDVKAHCDQKGYSLQRAICVAAMALNWEACTPTNATYLTCTCPILRFNRLATFDIPYHIAPTSRLFYGSRYKTCYRQCRESSESQESTYESETEEAQDTGRFGPYGKKKLL